MNRFRAFTASFAWESLLVRCGLMLFLSASLLIGDISAGKPQALSVPTASADHWVSLLEARYRAAKSTQATFLERYTESGRLLRVEAGQVYFRRPGKMRWEYVSPEKNLFLVDGKTAWFYVPEDHTVTRVAAKRSADWRTPLALLAGDAKVSRVCSHVEIARNETAINPGDVVLACQLRGATKQPKSGTVTKPDAVDNSMPGTPDVSNEQSHGTSVSQNGTSVFLEIAPDSGNLVRVSVAEKGGVGLEFRFENWQFDSVVADSRFEFHAPAGVAILNGELPLQEESVK
jgi:outer membrane lipoprotein-sorting protein